MVGRVLIVDDEPGIRDFIGLGLAEEGWKPREVKSGRAALEWLENNSCDVIFLDLHMDGLDGLEVLRVVRERWPEIMIIIMTGYATLESAIEAVHRGAFDYLQKPFDLRDLIACAGRAMAEKIRLEQQRRLANQAKKMSSLSANNASITSSAVKSGALIINMGSHAVYLHGERLSLTPTEYSLLRILAASPGEAFSVEKLVQDGLGYKFGDPQAQDTLRVHISRLRRKVGSDYILTVRGGGYALADIPAE